MKIETVWILSHGTDYEGDTIIAIFSEREIGYKRFQSEMSRYSSLENETIGICGDGSLWVSNKGESLSLDPKPLLHSTD